MVVSFENKHSDSPISYIPPHNITSTKSCKPDRAFRVGFGLKIGKIRAWSTYMTCSFVFEML